MLTKQTLGPPNQGCQADRTSQSAAKMVDEPKKKAEGDADNQTGNDGKVERGVFPAVDDVTGKFSKAEGKLPAEIEEGADDNQRGSKDE